MKLKILKRKKILTEEVALNRAALNKVFMQIAQKMAGSSGGSAPAASGGAPGSSPPAAGGGGIINRIKNAFKGNAGGGSPPPSPPSGSPAPAASGSGSPPPSPPSGSPAPAAGGGGSPPPTPPAAGGGKLGGQTPGADAAKAAGSQKQSTQNMNDYVKNVSAQINAAQTKPEKIELAKELINFMSDRKGSPEYDNAMGSAKAVLKKAGLNNMLAPLAGGQTANQNPQGLRNPPKVKNKKPGTPTPTPAADPDAAREQKRVDDLIQRESRVLHRNSYIFIKKVLENTDLTLRDLGYRVSISESTSDSVTLISR